jgi:hypothetical protein
MLKEAGALAGCENARADACARGARCARARVCVAALLIAAPERLARHRSTLAQRVRCDAAAAERACVFGRNVHAFDACALSLVALTIRASRCPRFAPRGCAEQLSNMPAALVEVRGARLRQRLAGVSASGRGAPRTRVHFSALPLRRYKMWPPPRRHVFFLNQSNWGARRGREFSAAPHQVSPIRAKLSVGDACAWLRKSSLFWGLSRSRAPASRAARCWSAIELQPGDLMSVRCAPACLDMRL